jgi:hypothetical protein
MATPVEPGLAEKVFVRHRGGRTSTYVHGRWVAVSTQPRIRTILAGT